ncbi:AAA family ATPase [Pararhodobacter sp.]|uniref:AAA family ATPase n=1 Tax=Pararhodobacter sp. TaxID=2127056 RepID=UPI002FDD429E
MRLRSLHLDRFGHFTDRRLDFGAPTGRPDFHIIYGPNEAGKTTTMEAVLRLFYGFPLREPYAFRHQRSNLRVSAVLETDGGAREFTRLPLRSGALVDGAGAALPEAALGAHLAGLAESDYRSLLCLDDETIERGGEEIAQARGDIGRLLFSAAAGVADLSTALGRVRDEADALWRKRASKTRMAELKRELAEVEKEIRARDVTAAAWRALKKAATDARTAEAAARAGRDALQQRAARITAKRRALPLLVSVDRLEADIAPYANYPERLDFDPEQLVSLLTQEAQAQADATRLAAEIDTLSAAREAVTRAPGLLALAGDLDALEELRSRDVTAEMDLPRRRTRVSEAEGAMVRAARDLGAAAGTDPGALVLPPADIARLEAARDALRLAQSALGTEEAEVTELSAQHESAQAAADGQAAAELPGADLAAILVQHDADRLAPAWAAARQAIASDEAALAAALDALSRGTTRFDSLPPCPVTLAQARAWADEHHALSDRIAQAADALTRHREDAAARAAQAAQLVSGGALIPDEQAVALQAERDRLWQAHRDALSAATALAFEAALHAVDAALRTRLAQARDLGQLRQIEQTGAEAKARADEAAKHLEALRAGQAALAAQVDAAAQALGLPLPFPAADWCDWVGAHATATAAQRSLERTQAAHAPLRARADRLLEALRPLTGLDDPDLDAALPRAREKAEAARHQAEERARATEALERSAAALARRKARLEAAQASAEQALRAWEQTVAELLGGLVAPATLLASFEPLRALREAEVARADAAQRVATMESDQAQFAAAMGALATAHALPEGATPAQSFAALRRMAQEAQAAEAEVARLDRLTGTARNGLEAARNRLAAITVEVQAKGQIFHPGTPVETLGALRQVAVRAQQVIAARTERAQQEGTLLSELSAPDLAAARALLDGASPALLEAEAAAVATDVDTAEAALTRATEARMAADQALAQVAGDADIATLTERKALIELQMEEAALDHLELHLGHRLAEEAIRRYRDTHRSAMMAATERSFAALTGGAYARLVSQPEGEGETLLAVDATGAAKRVSEMSKGTRFQLYLALRAAAHEQLVAQGTCLPFFCDDIFETFDEARTSAACRVMEQIGRSGQAIYLTHHRHVVEIARQVCDSPPTVHML